MKRTVVTTTIFDVKNNKSKKTFIQKTKTKSLLRTIPLPGSLVPIIKKALSLQKCYILKVGGNYKKENSGYIFLSELGEFINASNIDKNWIYFLKRLNIPHKKFHALRHPYVKLKLKETTKLLVISFSFIFNSLSYLMVLF